MQEEYDQNHNPLEVEHEGDVLQPVSFHRIEELESYGVNKTDITKLKAGGFHTVEAVRINNQRV